MILFWVFTCIVVFLLMLYSLLRYYHLWQWNHLPIKSYYVVQGILFVNLLVCQWLAAWLPWEILRSVLQGLSAVYLAVMLFTPFFCLIRGFFCFLRKKWSIRGKVFRFISHPSRPIYLCLILTACVGGFSFYQMRHCIVTEYPVAVEKSAETDQMKLVMISDVGFGDAMTEKAFAKLIKDVNDAKPDVILLCGNIIGSNTPHSLKMTTLEYLKKLSATYGVFYIQGNREAKLGSKCADWLQGSGITLLQDQTVYLWNGVQLVGLRDSSDKEKIPVEQILQGVDEEKPVIVAAHRAEKLQELAHRRADIVCCGHTPGAQYPPISFFSPLANDMKYGLKKYDTMSAVTTSGAGGFGIPVKLTVPSEMVVLQVRFNTRETEPGQSHR